MKFENYLLFSRIELVIALLLVGTSMILLISNAFKSYLSGLYFLVIPALLGVAFVLIVIALVTELIRYYTKRN